MKKILKRIGSIVITLIVILGLVITQKSSSIAANTGFNIYPSSATTNYPYVNKVVAIPEGGGGTTRWSAHSFPKSFNNDNATLLSGKYFPLINNGVASSLDMVYATLNGTGDVRGKYKYYELMAYQSVDEGNCPTTMQPVGSTYTPFFNVKFGSRLTIMNLYTLTKGTTYTFSVVAAQSDGGNTGSFYICPEIVNANDYFIDESDSWVGKDTAPYLYTPLSDGQKAIFIIRADTGNATEGTGRNVPIVWSYDDVKWTGYENSAFYMNQYPYMYIVYKPFTYTIKTEIQKPSGTGISTVCSPIRYGVNAPILNENTFNITQPSATGYHFYGWRVEGATGATRNQYYTTNDVNTELFNPDKFYLDLFKDATITGVLKPNTYTVNYNAYNPSKISAISGNTASVTHTYDLAKSLSNNGYSLPGYTFKGWSLSAGANAYYSAGTSVKNLTATNNGVYNLYTTWAPNNYTVTFNPNGGSVSQTSKTVIFESTYGTLPTPTRTGYIFNGWYTDAGTNVTNTTQVKYVGNHTLNARWTPISYSISYDSNRPMSPVQSSSTPTGSMLNTNHTYDSTTPLRPNAYNLKGWWFSGWNTSPDGTGTGFVDNQSITNLTATNGANIKLYAMWNKNVYFVNYDSNKPNKATSEVEGTMTNSTHLYDITNPLNENAYTLNGWTFNGWNTSADGNGVSFANKGNITNLTDVANGTVTLYAKWMQNRYNIQFDSNKPADASTDVQGTMNNQSYLYDDSAILPENKYTLEGYTFNGWNTSPDGSGDAYADKDDVINITSTNGDTVPLYAQWTNNTYSVKFDANEPTGTATGTMPTETHTFDKLKQLPNNEFELAGYSFLNWNTKPDGSGDTYYDMSIVKNLSSTQDDEVILYAQWTINSYDVTLDDNGATSDDHTEEVEVDYLDNLPDIIIPKKEFVVKFDGDTGDTELEDIIVKSDFTGYYDEDGIKYYDEDGKGIKPWDKPHDDTLKADWIPGSIEVPDCEKPGFDFVGWDDPTDDDDTPEDDIIYEPGDIFIPEEDTELQPIWKANITIYDIDIFSYNEITGKGILNTHKGTQLVGSECTATEKLPIYIEYEGYIYKASTVLMPTMNAKDNVIYRFYEPLLTISADALDTDGDKFFSKKEVGLLDIKLTGYATSTSILFPKPFKGTKWSNPVTGNTVDLKNGTTVRLDIPNPQLEGTLQFPFMTPDKGFDGTDFKIQIIARRNEPCDLFKRYVQDANLQVEVDTQCNLVLNLGFDKSNYLSKYLSSIRSFGAAKK